MKIVDVEPIIAMVQTAIAMIDIMKADSSGRSELFRHSEQLQDLQRLNL